MFDHHPPTNETPTHILMCLVLYMPLTLFGEGMHALRWPKTNALAVNRIFGGLNPRVHALGPRATISFAVGVV